MFLILFSNYKRKHISLYVFIVYSLRVIQEIHWGVFWFVFLVQFVLLTNFR